MKKYMGQDKHANTHANRRINTMNRPGLRAGSIENSTNKKKQKTSTSAFNKKAWCEV